MATPRLKGRTLSMVRALSGITTGLVWSQMSRDYGVTELLALPPSARGVIEPAPVPLRGAPTHQWRDASLDAPSNARSSAAALQDAYAKGAITPVEVLEAFAARVAANDFGDARNSPFIELDLPRARAAAEQSAARWQKGEARGPLDGVPVPVKDEHDMVGLPTRGGTAYLHTPAQTDSFCVRRLRAGGALLVGKTHTTEWGMSPLGFNAHYSMPRNIYSDAHVPGGSSTGSAVAVGLGLAPVAVCSDGGGSIRTPSSFNGLYGFKPSFIRVGRTGDIFGHSTVSHIGPIGASTTDLVDWLAVTAAQLDPDDPISAFAPHAPDLVASWRAALGRGVAGARIGIDEAEWADADPAIAALCERALQALEAEGAVRVDVRIPNARLTTPLGVLIIAGETMGGLTDDMVAHGAAMGDDLRLVLNLLSSVGARELFMAMRTRNRLRRDVAAIFAEVDLLALPSVAARTPAWPLADDQIAIADDDAMRGALRYAFLANLLGLPAGSMPVGALDGLPVGLQLIGDAWDEASVLAGMAHVERMDLGGLPLPRGYAPLV